MPLLAKEKYRKQLFLQFFGFGAQLSHSTSVDERVYAPPKVSVIEVGVDSGFGIQRSAASNGKLSKSCWMPALNTWVCMEAGSASPRDGAWKKPCVSSVNDDINGDDDGDDNDDDGERKSVV